MKDYQGNEIADPVKIRMGRTAPEARTSLEIQIPAESFTSHSPISQKNSQVDFSDFGGSKQTIDPNAVTPEAKVFPKQGSSTSRDGEYFVYRGFAGVAFRSKSPTAPDIKAKDPRQPIITADVKVRIFDLSNANDLLAYADVWDKTAKGFYVAPVEERQWVPEKQSWKVFMRWGVKYWELPDE